MKMLMRTMLFVGLVSFVPWSLVVAEDPSIASIDRVMNRFISDSEITGAVTLVNYRGKTVHLGTAGFADVRSRREMQADTMFWIASMTKPITATALHILQDDGKLSVDDEVSKYLPAFADVQLKSGGAPATPLTIRHLLTHTSGLDRGEIPPAPDRRLLSAHADGMAGRPLRFEPGSRWEYSASMHVVGRIIEVVSRMSFEEFLQQRIFEPLEMNDTTFNLNANQAARLATLYRKSADKRSLVPGEHRYVSITPNAGQHPSPSGGLFSTTGDVAKFYQMILSKGRLGVRIVSEEAIEEMTRLQTGELKTGWTPGNGWGLGWCVVRNPQGITGMLSPGSYGHGGVYGTQVWIDPERELIFLLMIQRLDLGNADGSEIRRVFQQAVVDAI